MGIGPSANEILLRGGGQNCDLSPLRIDPQTCVPPVCQALPTAVWNEFVRAFNEELLSQGPQIRQMFKTFGILLTGGIVICIVASIVGMTFLSILGTILILSSVAFLVYTACKLRGVINQIVQRHNQQTLNGYGINAYYRHRRKRYYIGFRAVQGGARPVDHKQNLRPSDGAAAQPPIRYDQQKGGYGGTVGAQGYAVQPQQPDYGSGVQNWAPAQMQPPDFIGKQQQQQQIFSVMIPEGIYGGMQMQVNVNGIQQEVTVPQGLQPGDQFQFTAAG